MPISKKEIQHIAKLAKLQFQESEEEILANDMSRMIDYIDTLNQVDTSTTPPLTHVHDLSHKVRSDSVQQRITHEDALKNAPDSDGEYFHVPKVIR